MIETVIACAILGVLLAILLPAVQSARGAARRMSCSSNLRQIMLAAHHYEQLYRVWNFHNPMFQRGILPFLELANLPEDVPNGLRTISILHCPAESDIGFTYFVNRGSGYQKANSFDGWCCADRFGETRFSDIPDGLSQTAAVSEAVVQSANLAFRPTNDPRRVMWNASPGRYGPGELKSFVKNCFETIAQPAARQNGLMGAAEDFHLYDHVMPPNTRSCFNDQSSGMANVTYAAFTVSSDHGGGVHVAFADGHVRFVADSIDPATWSAIGTRNGTERVDAEW